VSKNPNPVYSHSIHIYHMCVRERGRVGVCNNHKMLIITFAYKQILKTTPLYWKNKSKLMRLLHFLCACVTPYKLLNIWTNFYEIWYARHSTWTNLDGCFINPSHQFVCLCVSLLSRQRLGKYVPVARKTSNNIRVVCHVVFYAVRVVSKQCMRLSLP
jgi:hypothetical protein